MTVATVIALVWLVVLAGLVVEAWAGDREVTTAVDVNPVPVVIVPGARVFPDGRPSTALADRLDAAIALNRSGLAGHVLVSGDNADAVYNEPVAMRQYLLDAGLDEGAITLDYAGLDTWDTCRRAVEQFGVARAVVVTQHQYGARTGALCGRAGIDTTVLTVDPPRQRGQARFLALARENLAKVKAVHDLVRRPPAYHGGPYIGLVGSVDMPPGGHPPDWDWSEVPAG